MPSKTFYPNTITESGCNHCKDWTDKSNLKKNGDYAQCGPIAQKTGTKNTPSKLTVTNFKVNIPTGAMITKIKVEYAHQKAPYKGNNVNVSAPTITLVNVSGKSANGSIPTTKMTEKSVSFNFKPSTSSITSSKFGVSIRYPSNTNAKQGYLRLKYVRVVVTYTEAKYTVSISKAETLSKTIGDTIDLNVNVNNLNKVNYSPGVTIILPEGVTFNKKVSGAGSFSKSGSKITWKPGLSSSKSSANAVIKLNLDTLGQKTISIKENVTNNTAKVNVTVTPKKVETSVSTINIPTSPTSINITNQEEDTLETVHLVVNEWSDVSTISADENLMGNEDFSILITGSPTIEVINFGQERPLSQELMSTPAIFFKSQFNENQLNIKFKGTEVGLFKIQVYYGLPGYGGTYGTLDSVLYNEFYLNIRPDESELSTPILSLLKIEGEELNRLSDGYSYTVQSYIKSSGKILVLDDSNTYSHETTTTKHTTEITSVQNIGADFTLEFDLVSSESSLDNYICFLNLSSTETYNPREDVPFYTVGLGGSMDGEAVIWFRKNEETHTFTGGSIGIDMDWVHFKIIKEGNSFKFYANGDLITTQTIDWFNEVSEWVLAIGNTDIFDVNIKNILFYWGDGDTYVRDWYKNFRIAVFNNIIEGENVTHQKEYSISGRALNLDFPEYPLENYNYDISWDNTSFLDIVGYHRDVSLGLNRALITSENGELPLEFDNIRRLTPVHIGDNGEISQPPEIVNLTIRIINKNTNELVRKELHIITVNNEDTDIIESIIDSKDYENLTINEIFKNAEYWSTPLSDVNTFENKKVEFSYDEKYPLYLLFVGDYPEGDPESSKLIFTSPILMEESTEDTDEQSIFPVPIQGVISDVEESSQLNLENYQSSNSIVLSDFDVGDIETNEEMSILGIQVNFDVEITEDMLIFVTLINPNGVPGGRSIAIQKEDLYETNGKISIGGAYDLWGFDIVDMVNLDNWQVKVMFINPFSNNNPSQIIFDNVELVFYVKNIQNQLVNCYVNGKDTRHYGMFLDSVVIPSGLKTNVKYLDIDGTDRNEAYRQNIDKKEITIKFYVEGCTIEETTEMLKLIGKLFSNKRDSLNRPIPNQIEFTHYPGEYWNVILEDPIDSDVENATYSSTLKLIVPDGTSYRTEETVTGVVGTCSSIAKINPIITFIPEVHADSFTITESKSNQILRIFYSNFEEGDICELDCINRILYLIRGDESIDISDAVDWNADWFVLYGDYYFETSNCMVQTISFTERG